MENTSFVFEFISDIGQINQTDWNALAQGHGPFLQHQFLLALENSNSVCADSGWQPHHLLIYQNHTLTGILPLYIKNHSYGEYVFDFAWADAYHQHGLEYYPKLIAAIPFTPVTGSRLILRAGTSHQDLLPTIKQALITRMKALGISSLHWLFVTHQASELLSENDFLPRRSVQFLWRNYQYTNFEHFLSRFTARRRKSVKKERQKIRHAGIHVTRLSGDQIDLADMQFFYQCYRQTYLKRSGHEGYLKQAFFKQLFLELADNLLLVIAKKGDESVAAALYLFDQNQLCGRYWGAIGDYDGLHFECCYYQGIEFCIEKDIASFNPGTQGEHKILRGFEPTFCYSNHWLAEPAFHQAVDRFLQQERPEMELYKMQSSTLLPFKQAQ